MASSPSQQAIDLIKKWEGCKLEAYQDTKGIPTIGYGHTRGVVLGTTVTQQEAEYFLQADLKEHAQGVRDCLDVQVNQNQFDALCCFTFNVGINALKTSTLLKYINDGKIGLASEQLLQWNKETQPDGTKRESKGLTSRRKAEKALFEKVGA